MSGAPPRRCPVSVLDKAPPLAESLPRMDIAVFVGFAASGLADTRGVGIRRSLRLSAATRRSVGTWAREQVYATSPRQCAPFFATAASAVG